ncbi:ImmA/IrrE family metallo-endopeptidase [Pectobacterium carotovorum]|uniref:ImmA/IrrE family metallo-endopeptidase n=1 Tax=Pectobacterium carotovorum TaxID=554 RepID=UPI00193E836E|nr:hypothetical protein [Pectobacterium carotovorum]QRN39222.1 hypothetical protein IHJ55_04760 [Pectobacterium carotovorum]
MNSDSGIKTFSDVFVAAISDLESFYLDKYLFKVDYRLYEDSLSSAHASINGKFDNSFIRFSSDCCRKTVENITDYFVALIILCHELAHYLNHHNYYASPEMEDSRVLEAWADRFGMSIFMCLITFGEQSKRMAESLGIPENSGERINEIGKAFCYMHQYLYNNESKKYHTRGERIMHVAAGVNSFLESYWGRLDLKRSLDIYTRLYTANDLIDVVVDDIKSDKYSEDNWDKIRTIHLALQNGNSAITLGLKKEFRKYIDTSFIDSELHSAAYLKLRYLLAAQQSRMYGFDSSTKQFFMRKFLDTFHDEI